MSGSGQATQTRWGLESKIGFAQGCLSHMHSSLWRLHTSTLGVCVMILRRTMADPAAGVLAGQLSHLLSAQTLRQAAMHCRAQT